MLRNFYGDACHDIGGTRHQVGGAKGTSGPRVGGVGIDRVHTIPTENSREDRHNTRHASSRHAPRHQGPRHATESQSDRSRRCNRAKEHSPSRGNQFNHDHGSTYIPGQSNYSSSTPIKTSSNPQPQTSSYSSPYSMTYTSSPPSTHATPEASGRLGHDPYTSRSSSRYPGTSGHVDSSWASGRHSRDSTRHPSSLNTPPASFSCRYCHRLFDHRALVSAFDSSCN